METQKEFIEQVVHSFYKKALNDIFLGYHFKRIPDFSEHEKRIIYFWQNQLLGQKVPYQFDLIKSHLPLGIKKGEVNRWVKLFLENLNESKDTDKALSELWEKKVIHFQQVFLAHPSLFHKSP